MREEVKLRILDPLGMGRRIRRKREFLKITREELAGYLGVSSKFIADIECGGKGVSMKNLYRLTQTLNISADYILAGVSECSEETERRQIEQGILEPLKECNIEQLKCMEQISRFYVEGLKQK